MKLSRIIITPACCHGHQRGGVYAQNAEDNNVLSVSPQEFKSAYKRIPRHICSMCVVPMSLPQAIWLVPINSIGLTAPRLIMVRSSLTSLKPSMFIAAADIAAVLLPIFLPPQGFKVVNMKGGYLAWTANSLEIKNSFSEILNISCVAPNIKQIILVILVFFVYLLQTDVKYKNGYCETNNLKVIWLLGYQ